MEAKGRIFVAALLALAVVLAVSACGGSSNSSSSGSSSEEATTAESPGTGSGGSEVKEIAFNGWESKMPICYAEPESGPMTIGYASPTVTNEETAVLAEVIKAQVGALGGKLITEDANLEVDKQVSNIERLIADHVDAIIIFPLDPKALAPVLKRAQGAGIPVVGIVANPEGPNGGPGFTTQVSQRAGENGYLQAKTMAELVPAGSEIGQINFAAPVPEIEYQNSQSKIWAEKFGLDPVALATNPTDDISGGEKAMTGLLGEAPNIAGVIAYNDESATAAHSTARSQGKEIVSIGANGGSIAYSSVESGAIQASVQIPAVDNGSCAVKGAYDLAEGKKVPLAIAPGPLKVIDKNTISELPTYEEQIAERFGSE